MTSRRGNVNLNKEPFEGYVRHWKRQWVAYGDKTKDDKGAWSLKLIKWVQTGKTAHKPVGFYAPLGVYAEDRREVPAAAAVMSARMMSNACSHCLQG